MQENVEGACVANTKGKAQGSISYEKKVIWWEERKKEEESNKEGGWKDKYPPCPHCKKKNHTLYQESNLELVTSLVMWRNVQKQSKATRTTCPSY